MPNILFESLLGRALSGDARNTLLVARLESAELGADEVAECHLLLGLLQGQQNVGDVLRFYGPSIDVVRDFIRKGPAVLESHTHVFPVTDGLAAIVEEATRLIGVFGHTKIETHHLFKAMMSSAESQDLPDSCIALMRRLGFDVPSLQIKADIMVKLLHPKRHHHQHLSLRDRMGSDGLPREANVAENVSESRSDATSPPAEFFTEVTRSVIEVAQCSAEDWHESSISVIHLIFAISKCDNRAAHYARKILDHEAVRNRLLNGALPGQPSFEERALEKKMEPLFTEEVVSVLKSAWAEARQCGEKSVAPAHLLLGILRQAEDIDLFPHSEIEKLKTLRRDLLRELARSQMSDVTDDMGRPSSSSSSSSLRTVYESQASKLVPVESETRAPIFGESSPEFLPESSDEVLFVTARVERVLRFAKNDAIVGGHSQIGAPHLMHALIEEAFNSEIEFVKTRQLEWQQVRALLDNQKGLPDKQISLSEAHCLPAKFGPSIYKILMQAKIEAQRTRIENIDLNHLALAVIATESTLTRAVAKSSSVEVPALRRRLEQCVFWRHHTRHEPAAVIELHLSKLDEQITSAAQPAVGQTVTHRLIEKSLSDRSNLVMGAAVLEARNLHQSQISVENIMLGLIHETFGLTYHVFVHFDIYELNARDAFTALCVKASERATSRRDLSHNGWRLLEKALTIAQSWHDKVIDPEHILLAIADEHKGIAAIACQALDLDGQELKMELTARMKADRTR